MSQISLPINQSILNNGRRGEKGLNCIFRNWVKVLLSVYFFTEHHDPTAHKVGFIDGLHLRKTKKKKKKKMKEKNLKSFRQSFHSQMDQ